MAQQFHFLVDTLEPAILFDGERNLQLAVHRVLINFVFLGLKRNRDDFLSGCL